jgi:excisionase family DNA binding protein
MGTHNSDERSPWLRVSRWLRVSAWLPPGLAIAWLAALATLIRNTGIMVAAWAATVSLVLLVVLVAQRGHASRGRGSAADGSANAPTREKPSGGSVSTATGSAGTGPADTGSAGAGTAVAAGTRDAVGQPAARSLQHARSGAASTADPAGTTRPSVVTGHAPAATTYPSVAASPIGPEFLVPEFLVLTAEEVASVLRVDLNLVITSISTGALPGNQIGDHWRIDQRALTRWLQGRYGDALSRDPLGRRQAIRRAP